MGDGNSNLFHQFLVVKQRKILITELMNDQGVSINSFWGIKTEVLGVFPLYICNVGDFDKLL